MPLVVIIGDAADTKLSVCNVTFVVSHYVDVYDKKYMKFCNYITHTAINNILMYCVLFLTDCIAT